MITVMAGPRHEELSGSLFASCQGHLKSTSYLVACAWVDTAQGAHLEVLVSTRVFQELLQVLAAMSLHPADLHWS